LRGPLRAAAALPVIVIAVIIAPAAAVAEGPAAPTIDCELGYEGLRAAVRWLPGITLGDDGRGNDGRGNAVATASEPERWRVIIKFTLPGDLAHPAVTLRTLRKQVTGVWTSESKACGYGDRSQFAALMADMKSEDIELTNVSRAEVERKKQEQSPLAPLP